MTADIHELPQTNELLHEGSETPISTTTGVSYSTEKEEGLLVKHTEILDAVTIEDCRDNAMPETLGN